MWNVTFMQNEEFIPPVVVLGRLPSMRSFVPSNLFFKKASRVETVSDVFLGESGERVVCSDSYSYPIAIMSWRGTERKAEQFIHEQISAV